jgi:hypothetical protein
MLLRQKSCMGPRPEFPHIREWDGSQMGLGAYSLLSACTGFVKAALTA